MLMLVGLNHMIYGAIQPTTFSRLLHPASLNRLGRLACRDADDAAVLGAP